MPAADVLSVKDLASRWNVSPSTIYGLVNRGELPAVRFGCTIRFRAEVVEAWAAKQEAR